MEGKEKNSNFAPKNVNKKGCNMGTAALTSLLGYHYGTLTAGEYLIEYANKEK